MSTTKYVLVNLEQRHSSLNLGTYYRITWLDPVTVTLLTTSVDDTYSNFRHWRQLVQSPQPWGIYDNLHVTTRKARDGTTIISADRPPHLLEPLTLDQVELLLEALIPQDN